MKPQPSAKGVTPSQVAIVSVVTVFLVVITVFFLQPTLNPGLPPSDLPLKRTRPSTEVPVDKEEESSGGIHPRGGAAGDQIPIEGVGTKFSRSERRPVREAGAATSGDAGKKATAVVVWLHGLGDSPDGGFQNMLLTEMSGEGLDHIKWILPAAPFRPVTCNHGMRQNSWFDMPVIPVYPDSPPSSAREVDQAVRMVHEIINEQVRAGFSPSRILVGGFSQGAATTVVSSLSYPKALAGAAVLWGWIPLEESLFLKRVQNGSKKTPVLWSHGESDPVVAFGCALKGQAILKKAGVQCLFKGHANEVHHVHEAEFELLRSWVRERLSP